jgi:hypothetical protein
VFQNDSELQSNSLGPLPGAWGPVCPIARPRKRASSATGTACHGSNSHCWWHGLLSPGIDFAPLSHPLSEWRVIQD